MALSRTATVLTLAVNRARQHEKAAVSNIDRVVFAGLYHLAPEVLDIQHSTCCIASAGAAGGWAAERTG
jgi:hypothetical protein